MLERKRHLLGLVKQETAYDVVNMINGIGPVSESSGDVISAVRTEYDRFNDSQKAVVYNYSTLTAAESAYTAIVEDAQKVQNTEALISVIGTVTKNSGSAITIARQAYDALSEELKGAVTNYATLTAAEEAYDKIINPPSILLGDINGDGDITAADALLALQHSVSKITLEGDRLTAADVDGQTGVTAQDALLILQRSVNKIPSFPVKNKG